MKSAIIIGAVAAFALVGCQQQGQDNAQSAAGITGAGASFIYPVMAAWTADYASNTGDKINYQSVGSGAGIAQIKAGTVTFGASDKPLDPAELAEAGLAQFPMIIGGIVPVVNISGIDAGKLRLTGPILADIYGGKIRKWNDPAIVSINPDARLPDAAITPVHRSDSSGTTFNLTHYLSQVSAVWQKEFGEGTSINWAGGIGGKGNEGVAAYVKQVPNSIGYVEYAYVLQNNMAWTYLQNAAGNFVAPNAQNFQAAATTAEWDKVEDFFLIMTNAPGADAWPITATTFILMDRKPRDAAQTQTALRFFKWALEEGKPQAQSLDYVPIPDVLAGKIETYIADKIQ